MSSADVAFVPVADYRTDVKQAMRGLWDEIGSEILLLTLFCAGFFLFRVTAIRELLLGGRPQQFNKGKLIEKAVDDGETSSTTSTSECGGPVVKSSNGTTSSLRNRTFTTHNRRASSEAFSPALRMQEMQIRSAVEAKQAESALRALQAFCQAAQGACFPSGSLVAAVVNLVQSKAGGRQDVWSRLPAGAFSPGAVSALLELSMRSADHLEFLKEVCDQASKQDLALPASACDPILRAAASAGDSSAVEVFETFVQYGFEPSESSLTAVVSLCAESRHVRLAEHLVSYARRQFGRVSLALYSALVKVYGHCKLWHKTCDLYELIRKDGVEPDTVAYGSLIKAAVESGRPELARRLFRESGNPDLLNYMSMIRAAGRERDVPRALRLLSELEKSPLAADVTVYNCALEACAACNDRDAAEGLLRRMSTNGHIDVVSYNTYLKVLLASGALSQVNTVLEEMRARGCPPNAVTYNSMIRDAVARQSLKRAWDLVEAMENSDVRPDAFTCSILMKSVKHNPRSEDVDRIMALVQRARVTPDEVLVNCLLDACVRLRDPQRLTQVLDQCKATGVVPSLHAYATLIRAYGHARRIDRAWELWRDLTQGRTATPSEEAFAAMVEACLASGDLNGAAAVFCEVKEQLAEFPRAAAVFAACVKSCVQCRQAGVAVKLYSSVKDVLVCSKVAYNTLIDALVRQGDMNRANDLFRDMTLKNVLPDLITYSTLIKGYCSRGDLERGLQLLGLMQRRGIAPDAVLFNSILDGCAHKQMRLLTEQVLRDMESAGIAPSNFTLSILVKLYGRCSDLAAAFHVVDTYPAKYGFQINAQVYTCLMSACIANGELSRAMDVYEGMAASSCAPDGKTYQTLISGCLRHGDLDNATRLLRDVLHHGMARRLDSEAIEAVLLMAVRRGRGHDVATPLMEQLGRAGVIVSGRTNAAVVRGKQQQSHDSVE